MKARVATRSFDRIVAILRQRLPGRLVGPRRREPVSDRYGFDRGTPIDRRLIEAFLDRHRSSITGRALEVKDDRYVRRFGNVTTVDVVDIDGDNPRATIVGDLCDPSTLPIAAFDTIVVTQTLMYVADPGRAIDHLVDALAPGGHLVVTVAVTSRTDYSGATDRWRITPFGLIDLIGTRRPSAVIVASEALGNLRLSNAFLLGFAADEMPAREFERHDRRFPLLAAAVVRRPS